MSKYQITQQKGLGCCNLVIWDTLMVVVVAFSLLSPQYIPFEMHVVFRVLIGIAAAVVMFLLMKIKYLGAVIQIGFGGLWGYVACYALESLFHVFSNFENDPIMWWTLTVLIYALFIILHFASVRRGIIDSDKIIVESLDDDEIYAEDTDIPDEGEQPTAQRLDGTDSLALLNGEIERYKKMLDGFDELRDRISGDMSDGDCGELPSQLGAVSLLWTNSTDRMNNYIDIFNEAESDKERSRVTVRMREYINELSDETNGLQSAYSALLSQRLHSLPPTDEQSVPKSAVSFFHGCDTREKLDKRYKNLAKSFHPDLEAGDNESMQLVNEEYEKLKKQFE